MLAVQSQRSSFIQRLPICLPVCLRGPMSAKQVVKNLSPLYGFYANDTLLHGFKVYDHNRTGLCPILG